MDRCPYCGNRPVPRGNLVLYHGNFQQAWTCGSARRANGTLFQDAACKVKQLSRQLELLLVFVERTASDRAGGKSAGYHANRIRLEAKAVLEKIK